MNFSGDEVRFEEGRIELRGIRYLLIRPETLASLHKSLVNEVGTEKAREIMMSGGYSGGRASAEKFTKELGLSGREIVEFMCDMGSFLGWGRMDGEVSESEIKVRIYSSPFAESYGKAEKGVCHLIEGVFKGIGDIIFGNAISEEVKCIAKGDEYCEIRVWKG